MLIAYHLTSANLKEKNMSRKNISNTGVLTFSYGETRRDLESARDEPGFNPVDLDSSNRKIYLHRNCVQSIVSEDES
jgi:hypothetical protein